MPSGSSRPSKRRRQRSSSVSDRVGHVEFKLPLPEPTSQATEEFPEDSHLASTLSSVRRRRLSAHATEEISVGEFDLPASGVNPSDARDNFSTGFHPATSRSARPRRRSGYSRRVWSSPNQDQMCSGI